MSQALYFLVAVPPSLSKPSEHGPLVPLSLLIGMSVYLGDTSVGLAICLSTRRAHLSVVALSESVWMTGVASSGCVVFGNTGRMPVEADVVCVEGRWSITVTILLTCSSQREAWWSLFPNKDIPRMESFLNDVVSSFHFPLWAQWAPPLQLCFCLPSFLQLQLVAGSLVVPEAQLHFGFRSLGENEQLV